MGLRDESWCQSCGCSITYGQEECGDCANEGHYQDKVKLINYIKLHKISLEQDSEEIQESLNQLEGYEPEWEDINIMDIRLNGQISATAHLLSVASDILGIQLEEK